ncbi:site-2 protease family protein [Veillonella caviae]|uniref:site-2 protease family protein n=1 Tax=Veillonella caviae TaxID=248316 RepID=UPI0023F87DA8|nr:site-2 protease family protein [Veillonella caviae]
MFDFNLVDILARIPAIIIVLTVFGYAQAQAAVWLGDPTPKMAGRLNLYPTSHLELVGTLIMMMIGFGWSKPVPMNPNNFENPRRDITLVTFAGPLFSLVVGFIFTFILVLGTGIGIITSIGLVEILRNIMLYSIGIALFCLIPIPPLPGFNLILPWLPYRWQMQYYQLGMWNLVFLIILINTPILSAIIRPLMVNILNIYMTIMSALLGPSFF